MRYLPSESSAQRLLKNLAVDLHAEFDGKQLRQFGWFQYRDHDRISTLVATELAAHTFIYLSFDEQGSWRRNPRLLVAILAFMRRYFPAGPQRTHLIRLKALIESKPFDRQSITDWFFAQFPPEVAG